MKLVDAVEAAMGARMEAWPSSLLTLLFSFDPNMPYALTNLTKVIAFFFGNKIPLEMTCQFFSACSNYSYHLSIQEFTYLYDHWWSDFPSLPSSLYFDIREGRFKYTDGTYSSTFEDPIPDFGYEHTGFPTIARTILMGVNSFEYIEPVDFDL